MERRISSQLLPVVCTKCGATGEVETLCNVSIRVWSVHVKTLRCGVCGAGYKSLALVYGPTPAATES